MRIVAAALFGLSTAPLVAAQTDDFSGIQIQRDSAFISMGESGDVVMKRDGDGSLVLTADVTIEGNIEVTGTSTLDLDDRITDLETDSTTASERLDTLETSVGDLDTSVSTLEDADLDSRVADLETSVGVLETNADMALRVTALEEALVPLMRSSFCSRAECCNYNYEWDGDGTTLKCWASWYDSYEEDPCSCYATLEDLGSSTAFDHEKNCIEQGGHLFSVHGETANAAVSEAGATLWVGLYDRKNEGTWHNFDGTEANFVSWNSGEPNDSNGEDCVHTTGDNTIWNDQDCEESLSYKGLCLFQSPLTEIPSVNDATDSTDSLTVRVEALESDVAQVLKSSFCSKAECCNANYEWDGSELKCWASWYDSYDEDPCSCRAEVYDLGSATAFDHEKNCIENGAHLMSIHSATAGQAVADYGATMWLGLYDRKNEDTWHGFDGTEVNYFSWNSGEPNDSNGEDCVHTTGDNTIWNDQDCEESLSYKGICLWQ